jgi:aerobic-type carbon monoxide dehydrogenase small subunit (CoxS/CutS family)
MLQELGMSDYILKINGTDRHVSASPDESLLSVLRDRLDLTGTKYGCGEGQCAACTVLLDGEPVHSCITPLSAASGANITTIEGLEKNGTLNPVQQAFVEEGAFQCGYCTSGMVLRATALLRETPHPTEGQIVAYMNGNICRCGVYPRIIAAVQRASKSPLKAGGE